MSAPIRNLIESNPLAETSAVDLSSLPILPLPPLDQIRVTVPASPPISEDDLRNRFEELLYHLADRTPRSPGDLVAEGDEVLLDMVGYVEGQLLPFSAKQNFLGVVHPDLFMPGFGTRLVGAAVGDTTTIKLFLQSDFPVKELRRTHIVFLVEIKQASILHIPNELTPHVFQRFGLGDTKEAVLEAIALDLETERRRDLVRQGIDRLFDAILEKTDISLDSKLIDEEIRHWWRTSEGAFLLDKGLDRQDLDHSLQYWLTAPEIRADAQKRLQCGLILSSLARSGDISFQPNELQQFLDDYSQILGVDADAWKDSLQHQPDAQERFLQTYLTMSSLSRLLSLATIDYAD